MIAEGGIGRGFGEKSLGTKMVLAFFWRDCGKQQNCSS